ncbi:MAG: STAS domain-containing protein [Spirochaetota bacterium]
MNVHYDLTGDSAAIIFEGDVVFDDVAQQSDSVSKMKEAIIGKKPKNVVIDLAQVKSFDSSGVGLVYSLRTSFCRIGATVSLQAVPENVKEVLRLGGLLKVFSIT